MLDTQSNKGHQRKDVSLDNYSTQRWNRHSDRSSHLGCDVAKDGIEESHIWREKTRASPCLTSLKKARLRLCSSPAMTPAETSPPAPPPRASHPVSSPLLLQDPTTQATCPWREQLTVRGVAVAAALGALLCVVIHRLNLTVGVIPALNVASGLLAFFLAAAWRAAAGWLGFGRGPPFTRQENTVIQTCAIACAGLAFSGTSGPYSTSN